MPDLDFSVIDAEALPFAASPTMLFKLRIGTSGEQAKIHSVMLRAQIRIEATRRHYDAEAEARLLELFGEPERWGETVRSILWTQVSTVVPRFEGTTVAELPVACTYDFEVAAAKYFYALEDGEVPLLFLFSGTVFYAEGDGKLQITQIPWEKEAHFQLPIETWKEMMDRYFPNSGWVRLRKDVFDRLYRYRAERALATWEETVDELLDRVEV